MAESIDPLGPTHDLVSLVVPGQGGLRATEDLFEPYRLVDASGREVVPVSAFLRELQACGRAATTQRSYGMALLRWFRFLWAIGVPWNQATRVEARDFSRWVQVVGKPVRPHWRRRGDPVERYGTPPAGRYAPVTVTHGETVLRTFYEFHVQAGTGPLVNPFPLSRPGRHANAHHNPMDPYRQERSGLYRPRLAQRVPRQIPDAVFNEMFTTLASHRDRALVAFWVSTGARASELLGATCGDLDPGLQLVTVVRKGSRALQQLPASPDAFVWLRLYQAQMQSLVTFGRDDPLWWTLRRPFRQLTYHAAHRMFTRVNTALGQRWTLHDLRHTAAYRMARDPQMSLTDVQWVLGHAHLSTTQLYVSPLPEDVIASVLAHHERQGSQQAEPVAPGTPRYRTESLNILFGTQS